MLVLVGELVVLDVHARQADFTVESLVHAARRSERVVAGVAGPADRGGHGHGIGAVAVHVVLIALRGVAVGVNLRGFDLAAEEHAVVFRERDAERERGAAGFVFHVGDVELFKVDAAVIDFPRAADALGRDVRFDDGERVGALGLRRVDVDGHGLAGTEDVVLREARRKDDAVGRGVARTERDGAGRTLLHLDVDVDLVARARHGHRVGRHGLEVAETVDAVARELDLGAVEPSGFVLADFTADHLVLRAVVARDVHAANIGAAARVDCVDDLDRAVLAIGDRIGRRGRKGVAERGELVDERRGDVVDLLGTVDLARLERQELVELLVDAEKVARELGAGDRVLLALGHVDRDVDVGLVGRDGNLDGVDLEVEVALIHVEGADRLKVGRKLFTAVEIALRVPAEPVRHAELHLVEQLVGIEEAVAREADRGDRRGTAFVDVDRDAHAIAFERRGDRLDLHAVIAAGEVLAAQLLVGAVKRRLVEDAALGHADVAQAGLDSVLVEGLDAVRLNGRHGGTLDDVHDEHVAVLRERHVLEEAGAVERVDGAGAHVGRVLVACAERKMRKDRTGFGTHQAFNSNVGNDKSRGPLGAHHGRNDSGGRLRQIGRQNEFSLYRHGSRPPPLHGLLQVHPRRRPQTAAANLCKVTKS